MSGSGSRNPNIARLGMVWTTLASQTIGAPSRGRRAASTPTGMPIAIAAPVDTATSTTCWSSSARNSARCAARK